MPLRTEIETALDDLIAHEEGMKFQSLAVILAKEKWSHFIACGRKWDRGLDAHAPASLDPQGVGRGLASALSGSIDKIKSDAQKIKEHFSDVGVLIFATAVDVTNHTAIKWKTKIHELFGFDLVVMGREDIVTSLMLPSNAELCRSHLGLQLPLAMETAELLTRVREATSEVIDGWLKNPRITGKPLISLNAIRLDQHGREADELLYLESIEKSVRRGERLILEAAAGCGKTTTLIQMARRVSDDRSLAFLLDLPAWAQEHNDILEFIARMPQFRSRNISAQNLAGLCKEVHFSFLLNGWNEISETYSENAVVALAQVERNFPAAGIVVATRTHHIIPPLPGSFRAKILNLSRSQRFEYLRLRLGSKAEELDSKLRSRRVLDDLTRTPLILSEVATIFEFGGVIPETKLGVLGAVIGLIENSTEHRNALQSQPLGGHARNYLVDIAIGMAKLGDTRISEVQANAVCSAVSLKMKDAGQLVTLPEPASIVNGLCAHHVLERTEYPSISFRFQHQQFQEFYAALWLGEILQVLTGDAGDEKKRLFQKSYVNEPSWDEPIRMIAEQIGIQSLDLASESDVVSSGKLLVEMALTVDPILAAELARLTGAKVWAEIRINLTECLREWYQIPDEHHRQCAIAAMLASGSAEFADIVIPLLSNDRQTRLAAYQTYGEFHLSSLGNDWWGVVQGWTEDARIDFVLEMTRDRWIQEIAERFAVEDPSRAVRAEAARALNWIGTTEDVARVMSRLDDRTFELAVQKFEIERIPAQLRVRAIGVYKECLEVTQDATSRIRVLFILNELGEPLIGNDVRAELSKIKSANLSHQPLLMRALTFVRTTDPEWVADWVLEGVIDGSWWYGNADWASFAPSVPGRVKQQLLEKISGEELVHVEGSRIISILSHDPADVAYDAFVRLCRIRENIAVTYDPASTRTRAIARQLQELLRAIDPQITVSALSATLDKAPNVSDYAAIVSLFGQFGLEDMNLREHLEAEAGQRLRTYLKDCVPLVLAQDDFSGRIKAELAFALSRIGVPEDTSDLWTLIQADIRRLRDGRAARAKGEQSPLAAGSTTSYANWYVRAIANLDPNTGDLLLLKALEEPEYERDAGWELVRLSGSKTGDRGFGLAQRDYKLLRKPLDAPYAGFDENRRARYSDAIKTMVQHGLNSAANSGGDRVNAFRLKELAMMLSILDSQASADLVLQVAVLPCRSDDWMRVGALENLLFSGLKLPTEATLNILNPTIEEMRREGIYNNQNSYLVMRCLCLLAFVDEPNSGFDRIRQIISETKFPPHELGGVLAAVGSSRRGEAVSFLRELAGVDGGGLQHIGRAWIDAIAGLGTADSREILLSFIDSEVRVFDREVCLDSYDYDLLISRIVEIARKETSVAQRIFQLCSMATTPLKRDLILKIVSSVGTREAILAGLNLIADDANPAVPYEFLKGIESQLLEHRPYGTTANAYTVVPRDCPGIRRTLFEMALGDPVRKKSAFALLGQIEMWRLEYGRPSTEPRHPAVDTGAPWPPIERFLDAD
jgi:hypothetical protein